MSIRTVGLIIVIAGILATLFALSSLTSRIPHVSNPPAIIMDGGVSDAGCSDASIKDASMQDLIF